MNYQKNSVYIELEDNRVESLRGSIISTELSPIYFEGLNQLLMIFEQVCNTASLPQAAVKLRSFTNEEGQIIEATKSDELCFKANTIVIQVIIAYRQNATWQGYVVMDGEKCPFKSELEFIRLLERFIEE